MSLVALTNQHIVPLRLTDRVDHIRLDTNHRIIGQRRSELGQFLTPGSVARLMAAMLICDVSHVSILDAGVSFPAQLLKHGVEELSWAVHEPPLQACQPIPVPSTKISIKNRFILSIANELTSCTCELIIG